MQDPEPTKQYAEKDLEQRRTWYSPAAEAYDKVRPHYPPALVDRVLKLAQLPEDSAILEIGCGPGTATVSFAELGFSVCCLEPNPDFYAIACRNCAEYPNVRIHNISLEEWPIDSGKFDAVLAATSIHWIAPDVAYPKIADALRENGVLALLWNAPGIPTPEFHQALREAYEAHAPSLSEYKEIETYQSELRQFEKAVSRSGRFDNPVFETVEWRAEYKVDEYLMLLSTFSPYLALGEQTRRDLFEALRGRLASRFTDRLPLSHLSAFHLARQALR